MNGVIITMKNKFLEDDIKKIHENIDFSEMKNKSILIAGSTGLIGLYILLSLKDIFERDNIKITIIYQSTIDKIFYDFIDFTKVECIIEDITNINALDKRLGEYDYIINAAGYGQPNKFLEDQLKTIELNTSSTILLFSKLKKGGKFLFVSSSEVYSGINTHQTEDIVGTTTPDHPRACYIEGKKCGETICNIHRKLGVNAKSVRLSLTYGPGTKRDDKRMLSNFIQKGLINKEIKLLDHGKSTRTFLYVADAVIMFWNILFNGKENTYNVGSTESKSIFNAAKMVGKIMNVPVIKPEDEHSLIGSPKSVKISMNRYKNEFGDLKMTSFNRGLKNTINWCKSIYENE